MHSLLISALFAMTAHAAGPAGPGVLIKQVTPGKTHVKGVTTLEVQAFQGTDVDIKSQILAAYADTERLKTDNREIAKEALGVAADVGSQYLGGMLGGGLGSKLVQNVTKNTIDAAAEGLETEPLKIEDGLQVNPWEIVESGGSSVLAGQVQISDEVEDYTTKEQQRDSNGNPVTDSDGNPVMIEVPCRRRMVTVQIDWSVSGSGETAGDIKRQGGDARCGAQMSDLLDANTIAQGVLQDVGMPLIRDIAPAWRIKRLALNRTKAAKDALKYVKKEDWEGAKCAFAKAAKANPKDSDVVFGYGVMLEAFGHLDAADAQYDAAIALKDKKPYHKAKDRIGMRNVEIMALADVYGMTYAVPKEPAGCGG